MPVGLKNTGNLCYFNSLVQTYFFLRPTLLEAVLTAKLPVPKPAAAPTASASALSSSSSGARAILADFKHVKPTLPPLFPAPIFPVFGTPAPALVPAAASASSSSSSSAADKKAQEKAELAMEFLRQLQRTFVFLHLSIRKFYVMLILLTFVLCFALGCVSAN
jgi:hypothetical protein